MSKLKKSKVSHSEVSIGPYSAPPFPLSAVFGQGQREVEKAGLTEGETLTAALLLLKKLPAPAGGTEA